VIPVFPDREWTCGGFSGPSRKIPEYFRRGKLQGGSTITQQLATAFFLTASRLPPQTPGKWCFPSDRKRYSKKRSSRCTANQFNLAGVWGSSRRPGCFSGKGVCDLAWTIGPDRRHFPPFAVFAL